MPSWTLEWPLTVKLGQNQRWGVLIRSINLTYKCEWMRAKEKAERKQQLIACKCSLSLCFRSPGTPSSHDVIHDSPASFSILHFVYRLHDYQSSQLENTIPLSGLLSSSVPSTLDHSIQHLPLYTLAPGSVSELSFLAPVLNSWMLDNLKTLCTGKVIWTLHACLVCED